MKYGEPYVRRCYNRFRRQYWPDGNLPDFDELDFEFEEAPNEWGSVSWNGDGMPSLSLHPVTRLDGAALRATLAHEMIHIAIGARYGHGKAFWAEAKRIHDLGIYREYFG